MDDLKRLYQRYVTSSEYERLCAAGNTERMERINDALREIPDKQLSVQLSELTAEETRFFEKQAFVMGFKYAFRLTQESKEDGVYND